MCQTSASRWFPASSRRQSGRCAGPGARCSCGVASAKENGGKLIEPPAPGMTLRYLLTGLVRCGHCSRAMNPTSSAAYVTKSGEAKRYTAYSCPGSVSGVCPNGTRVPENWLRKVVIGTVRQRLFPGDGHGVPDPTGWRPDRRRATHADPNGQHPARSVRSLRAGDQRSAGEAGGLVHIAREP